MRWFKDRIVNYRIKQKFRTISGKSSSSGVPSTIKQVGIIAESVEDFEIAKALIRDQWGLKIRVIAHFYASSETKLNEGVTHNHFSWSGFPSDYFNEFLDEHLDFILVSSSDLSPYMRYLLLAKENSFKIGFYSEQNKSYLDLMVAYDKGKDLADNLKLVIEYLLKIRQAC